MTLTQYQLINERMPIPEKDKTKLWANALGSQGEQWFNHNFKLHLAPGWHLLEDLWLAVDGHQTQIDSLIVTPWEWWIINVKNHQRIYRQVDGDWVDQQGNTFNRMYLQMRRSKEAILALQARLPNNYQQIEIKTQIVFVHPKGGLILDNPKPLAVSCMYWFDFIGEVYRLRQHHHNQALHQANTRTARPIDCDPAKSVELILNYQIPKPKYAKICSVTKDELLTNGKRGIACQHCRQMYTTAKKKHFFCSCGHREAKSAAIQRTAYELMKMTSSDQITRGEIAKLCDDQVDKSSITRALDAEFVRKGRGRNIYYKVRDPLILDRY